MSSLFICQFGVIIFLVAGSIDIQSEFVRALSEGGTVRKTNPSIMNGKQGRHLCSHDELTAAKRM